jgi:uncharacterized protein YfdQ (DUF2303 family)
MPITADGKTAQVLMVPKGMEALSAKKFLDELLDAPKRREGTAVLGNLESFIAHTIRFKDDGSTIFAQRREDAPSLTSILDYHPAGSSNGNARFGKHRGTWKLPTSEAWEAWRRVDGKGMSQLEFAEFLEKRVLDLVEAPASGEANPSQLAAELLSRLGGEFAGPSRLIEVARGLKLSESSEVVQAQNLATGEMQVVYRTEHKGQTVNGEAITVPSMFLIGVPVFDGGAPYRMPVRLRYRKVQGSIVWTIERYRPDLIFFAAFDEATERAAQETGLPIFIGTPEA